MITNRYNNSNAQASVETLLIVGIVLFFIAIISALYISFTNESTSALNDNQMGKVFSDITSKATRVYFQGSGNRLTIDTTFPEGIKTISIHLRDDGIDYDNNPVSYTYLNVSLQDDRELIYIPNDLRVVLNCSYSCSKITSLEYPKEFSYRATTSGNKQIRVESRRDDVLIDFGYDDETS